MTRPTKTPSYRGLRPRSAFHSDLMRRNTRRGGIAEIRLAKALREFGLRPQRNVASLPGKPDFVFKAARVCVFCDGDFWHGKDHRTRIQQLRKGHNGAYWAAKITRNRLRDKTQTAE